MDMFLRSIRFNKPALYCFIIIQALSFTSMAQKSIALADLAAQGVDPSASSIISDRLRNDLFAVGHFTVIERSQMDQILKEQGFQQSGCTSDACAVEVGQLLGVQYIAVGSVGLLGKTYTINVRMIDVKTGKIVRIATEDCKCEIDDLLKKSVPNIAGQLSQARPETTAKADQSRNAAGTTMPVPVEVASNAGKPAKNRLMPRILAGVVALGAAGAGVYFNNVMTNENNQRTDLYTAYINAGGSPEGTTDLQQSQDHGNKAKTASGNRTVSYIIAGLGAVGFVLTFAF
ncbi:MAG: CsgG/HfaB family protein [Chitinivibrionales bacterium]